MWDLWGPLDQCGLQARSVSPCLYAELRSGPRPVNKSVFDGSAVKRRFVDGRRPCSTSVWGWLGGRPRWQLGPALPVPAKNIYIYMYIYTCCI